MSSEPSRAALPPSLDPVACARWDAWPHNGSPWLHEEIARRMEDRLQWIRLNPKRWVDWAPVNGGLKAHSLLRQRYAQAQVNVIEPNAQRQALARAALGGNWLQRLVKQGPSFDAPEAGSADMLWANMALHTSANPQALLQQWHRLLAVDGFVMFSCLGPDTCQELQAVYQAQGWTPPAHAFTDMHDWGDMLVEAGFAEPVMDMERITLTYETPERMLQDLRGLGRNLHVGRFAHLRGKAWRAQLLQALASTARTTADGRLALTIEVIYGHALKPTPRFKVAAESTVSLQDLRASLQKNKTSGV
jgi:malonyl-CoA O-methyltransferase